VLAAQSAAALRAERLALARSAKQGDWPGAGEMVPGQRGPGSGAATAPAGRTGDRALRNPASERDRAGTLATGARQQASRDNKRAGSR
jgi:hypothetical protein